MTTTPAGMPLSDLTDRSVSVTLDDGRTFKVRKLDAFGYQLSKSATNEIDSIDIVFKLAARCLKGQLSTEEVLGSEDVIGLSIEDAAKVVATAGGQVEVVEASVSPLSVAAATTAAE